MGIDLEQLANIQALIVAEGLLAAARQGGNEAEFRKEVARILEDAGAAADLKIMARDEFSVARGRVDSVYNRLILEYKRPGIIKANNKGTNNQGVIQQVKDYMEDVARRERREAQRLAGVALDGLHFIFVRRVGEGWVVDDPVPVNTASTERFLRLLFSLSAGAALVPENLIEDFGPRTLRAQRAVRALYAALHTSKNPLVAKLFEQWRQFYSEATDYGEWSTKISTQDEFRSFVRGMGLDPAYSEPARVFFALHTYYALLIKLIAALAAARFAPGSATAFTKWAGLVGDDLKNACKDLERGGLFREFGFRNFLEGDFFGWYLAAWDDSVEDAIGQLVQRLADYDPGTLELAPENARDLLKKLYHYLLPRDIRHTLGEYYTPDWLAERLIRITLGEVDLGNATKRVLDPACGSGTFLVLLIKHIKERSARNNQDPAETLDLILKNVVGIDLNPLAVIAARTNYLLALGDLLQYRRGDIDIPVYQADSVLTPARGSGLFEGNIYPLKTAVGEFQVPASFTDRSRMDALTNILDEAVEARVSEDVFLSRLRQAAGLDQDEIKAIRDELIMLYSQLCNLHEQGLDGVWARIIKNAFTPLFLEPCHYIVGNPPWVNWENLPDDYRPQIRKLFEHYGLFPHGGMDTILGKGKKDISMLMTYVAGDKYLRPGGKLGFVITQSVFKTSGAGQGFRRFSLPDKTPFAPIVVEDMVELNPFEGATNRTAVVLFIKGRAIKYPIPYSLWKKREQGRGSIIGFDTPYEEVIEGKIARRDWFAEPVNSTDATSSWLTARPKALKAMRQIIGHSPYSAYEGSNTGGANGIYWVEITGERPGGLVMITNITEGARRIVQSVNAAVEKEALYALLRGRDVQRWVTQPSAHIIMAQDPATRKGIDVITMEGQYPRLHSYLARFEALLRSRAAFRRYFKDTDPYWSMFNISSFTFAPWKVVWREQASTFTAAVVGPLNGRPVIPDHKLMMVEAATKEEAHYLCAVLNSAPARLAIISYVIQIQMDTHILENINVPKFSTRNKLHQRLADLSEAAHRATASGDEGELRHIEEAIDICAAQLWDLTEEMVIDIKQSLEEA
jgi:methylase of polypeptide subunit release factors